MTVFSRSSWVILRHVGLRVEQTAVGRGGGGMAFAPTHGQLQTWPGA